MVFKIYEESRLVSSGLTIPGYPRWLSRYMRPIGWFHQVPEGIDQEPASCPAITVSCPLKKHYIYYSIVNKGIS